MSSVVAREGETSFKSRSDTIPTSFPASDTIGMRRIFFSFIRPIAREIDSVGFRVNGFGVIHLATRTVAPPERSLGWKPFIPMIQTHQSEDRRVRKREDRRS